MALITHDNCPDLKLGNGLVAEEVLGHFHSTNQGQLAYSDMPLLMIAHAYCCILHVNKK